MAESKFRKVFFSIYSYIVFYTLFSIVSTSYHACFMSSLSTLEKRFHFSSTSGGYIMIADNVAMVLVSPLIGYYGRNFHKPRWMALGCLISGLGIMISTLPYFIYGPAKADDDLYMSKNNSLAHLRSLDQMCLDTPFKEDHCEGTKAIKTMTIVALSCLMTSNFIRGVGATIFLTNGTPYLDDNLSKRKSPAVFAIIFAARLLGSPTGYFFMSKALKLYENPFAPPVHLNYTDSRWIGAWWIGFLISGLCALLCSIPLSLFPREFKKRPKNRPQDVSLTLMSKSELTDGQSGEPNTQVELIEEKKNEELSLKNMPHEVYRILSNPLIICQFLGNSFRGVGLIGFFVFQTRYLETQFRQTASEASLVSGTTGFLAKISGVLFGGFIISLFRPRPRMLTTYICSVEMTSIMMLLIASTIAGPVYVYPQTTMTENHLMNIGNTCNMKCNCEHMRYQPVCEPMSMKAYFSPCHAGCKNSYKTIDGGTSFTECTCSDEPLKPLEKCNPEYENFVKYITFIALGAMISGSSRSGNLIVLFRSIEPEQKTLTVAISGVWQSLFVAIPYPILYGKIFDFCCMVWSKECNITGNCWLYDSEKLRYLFHGIAFTLVILGSVFDVIMIYLSPRLRSLYDDDIDGATKTTVKQRLMFWRSKPLKQNNDVEEN